MICFVIQPLHLRSDPWVLRQALISGTGEALATVLVSEMGDKTLGVFEKKNQRAWMMMGFLLDGKHTNL